MADTFTSLLAHVFFSTSGRVPSLPDAIRPEAHAHLGLIPRKMDAAPIVIGGTADHAHILMRLPADLAVADCLRLAKANSSRWVKERWPERRLFAWQGGYGAFSVSESRRGAVIAYIQDQPRHHRRISFQDEFFGSLKLHGVEFEERYLWQ